MFSIRCNSRVKSWTNKKDSQGITKVKPFINKYNWEGINLSSEKEYWKQIDKNNIKITLNVLYAKEEKTYPAYISNHNSNREKQVILLMISNGEKRERSKTLATQANTKRRLWHYLEVKRLSTLLRRITSNNNANCYC